MRTSEEVARRALSIEIMTQRAVIEGQALELGDEAHELHAGLVGSVEQLDLESSFEPAELALLRAAPGTLSEDDPTLDMAFADLGVLLWCLGRIPRLLTIDELKTEAMGEMLGRGFLAEAEGSIGKVEELLKAARLRSREAIEAELKDVAKANALLTSSGPGPHTSVPPMTVFYVLPWLLSDEWPWGRPCALEIEDGPLAGTTFGIEGLGVPRPRPN